MPLQLSVSDPRRGRSAGDLDPLASRGAEAEAPDWTCHARGLLGAVPPAPSSEPLDAWPPAGCEADRGRLPLRPPRRGRLRIRPGLPGPDRRLARRRARSTPRSRSTRSSAAKPAASGSTRPCSTRPCTRSPFKPTARPRCGCPLPGAGSRWCPGSPGELRVRLSAQGETALAADCRRATAMPVSAVGSLALRPIDPAQVRVARREDEGSLDRRVGESCRWSARRAARRGPSRCAAEPGGDPAEAARSNRSPPARRGPGLAWRRGRGAPGAPHARSGGGGSGRESPDPVLAAAWGFLRSVQSEHPGRLALDRQRRQRGLRAGPAGRACGSGQRRPAGAARGRRAGADRCLGGRLRERRRPRADFDPDLHRPDHRGDRQPRRPHRPPSGRRARRPTTAARQPLRRRGVGGERAEGRAARCSGPTATIVRLRRRRPRAVRGADRPVCPPSTPSAPWSTAPAYSMTQRSTRWSPSRSRRSSPPRRTPPGTCTS